MSRSKKRIVAMSWTLLATVAAAMTIAGNAGETPTVMGDPYYGDSCRDTCPNNCVSRSHLEWFYQNCCLWDWGCWANPVQPNDQIWWSKRERVACTLPPPDEFSMPPVEVCCARWHEAIEENGPCCYQQDWNCPP